MRGKLLGTLLVALGIRITPADAGKTECNLEVKHEIHGSPPRMRGKLYFYMLHGEGKGITPADAGKTT